MSNVPEIVEVFASDYLAQAEEFLWRANRTSKPELRSACLKTAVAML